MPCDDVKLPLDSAEKKYKKESLWHSFTSALYWAVASASFIGLLSKVADVAIKVLATSPEPGAIPNMGQWAVMGGMMAVGIASAYMAQVEGIELRCIQDQWLARKNAEALGKKPELGLRVEQAQTVPLIEHQYDRKHGDGKKWTQAVAQQAERAIAMVRG